MPKQRSRTRAVIPGKAILGVAGAAIADRKTLGGAVVPGRRILGDIAAQEQARALEARRVVAAADPKAATGAAPKAEQKKDDGLPPLRAPRAARAAKQAPPPAPSLSEGEAVAMLEADPEQWEQVLDLEAERPDGIRPAVAAAVVAIAPKLVENLIDPQALVALRELAGEPAA